MRQTPAVPRHVRQPASTAGHPLSLVPAPAPPPSTAPLSLASRIELARGKASWYLMEKPILRLKHRFERVSAQAAMTVPGGGLPPGQPDTGTAYAPHPDNEPDNVIRLILPEPFDPEPFEPESFEPGTGRGSAPAGTHWFTDLRSVPMNESTSGPPSGPLEQLTD
jgi:hypothetical protein